MATRRAAKQSVRKEPKRRTANVPGQFYGYSIQITRVVAHFLHAIRGHSVSIEHLDDVATHTDKGDVVEQDKSGLAHNPIADRSPELWKSLANWVRAIRAGALNDDTRFRLYVAQEHTGDLIEKIHGATTKVAADTVVARVRAAFKSDAPLPTGLVQHVEDVLSASDDVLARLFINLTLENGSGAPNDDLASMPGMAAISESKKPEVLTHLLGWAKRTIDKRIEEGHVAIIRWDEFHTAFVAAAKKFDRADSVLVANAREITETELQNELRDRVYVRQLQVIGCQDDDLIRAVHDYLRSITHRTNWSEDGDVIETSFDEFESSLDRAWSNQKSVVDIEQKSLADADRGRLLYAKCQQLKVPLQGMDVPDFFVPGSFHTMADSLRIGWHPRYRESISARLAGRSSDAREGGTGPAERSTERPSTAREAGGGA